MVSGGGCIGIVPVGGCVGMVPGGGCVSIVPGGGCMGIVPGGGCMGTVPGGGCVGMVSSCSCIGIVPVGGCVGMVPGGGCMGTVPGGGCVGTVSGSGLGRFKDKFDCRINDPFQANFHPNMDFLSTAFAVGFSFFGCVQIHFTIPAFLWGVISEHIKRKLAGVEPAIAKFYLIGFIVLSSLILESSAF